MTRPGEIVVVASREVMVVGVNEAGVTCREAEYRQMVEDLDVKASTMRDLPRLTKFGRVRVLIKL